MKTLLPYHNSNMEEKLRRDSESGQEDSSATVKKSEAEILRGEREDKTGTEEAGGDNIYSQEESGQKEKDAAKLRKVREMLKTFEKENLSDKPQEASGEMAREEKLDKVLNREGSFDEKFALLKGLKEERFEFESGRATNST